MSVSEGEVTAGVDIGTTSVKAVVADASGQVLARARVPHELRVPFPGAFEHDARAAWQEGVVAALAAVVGEHRVAAVNVAAMVPSLTAVGDDGVPVGPGLLYGDARGGVADDAELLSFLGWQQSSFPSAAGYWPAQAAANHALCGRGVIDSTTAVTAHPLFDYVGWDPSLADVRGLPEIVSGVEPAGLVQAGLPGAGALVGGGTIDALAEQLVAGADAVGDVLVLLGTTLIAWVVVPDPVEVPGLWCVPHTAPPGGLWLVGGPSNAGGLFVDWVRRQVGEQAPVGADDLPVWRPYLRGERVPLHDSALRASLSGVALHHTGAHLLQAAYEASAFTARRIIELAGGGRRLVVTGGGSRSATWVQALADVTGLPADVVAVPEGAALGSAFIARCVASLEGSMADAARWARTSHRIEPRQDAFEAASARYPSFFGG